MKTCIFLHSPDTAPDDCPDHLWTELDLEWIPRVGDEICFAEGGWEMAVESVTYCIETQTATIHIFCPSHEWFLDITSHKGIQWH